MYVVILFLLVILSGISNATMDIWAFHYPDSKLKKWGQKWPRFRRFSGPDSWKNKHRFTGLGGYLMRTVFSFVTDLWHLCQFVFLTSFQILIAWHCPDLNEIGGRVGGGYFPSWVNVLIWVGLQKIVFGVAFEMVFFWMGKKKTKKYICKKCGAKITPGDYEKSGGICRDCWAAQFLKNFYQNPLLGNRSDN